MTARRKRACGATRALKSNREKRQLPPDPGGLFKAAARRAKMVIDIYERLNPSPERQYLVANLLHDLMHLCDRDPTLGDVDEECVFAIHMYEELVEESEWMAG